MNTIIRFQEIEQFRNTIKNVQHKAQFVGLDVNNEPIINRLAILPKLNYEGTVKIHGCCSSVRLEGNETCFKITPQSRNQELSIENDNYGFAKYIFNLPPEVWNIFIQKFGCNIVIHGEWAGLGIQDTVAVNQLERFWSVFRIQEIDITDNTSGKWIVLDDTDFSKLNEFRIFNIRQFGVEKIEIDFEHPAESINKMNELTLAVEAECPVAKFFFDKEMTNNIAIYTNGKLTFKYNSFINNEIITYFKNFFISIINENKNLNESTLEIKFSI